MEARRRRKQLAWGGGRACLRMLEGGEAAGWVPLLLFRLTLRSPQVHRYKTMQTICGDEAEL